MIVVDASVLVTALLDQGEAGRTARQRLAGEQLTAPELLDLEVTSVIRRTVLRGELSERAAKLALQDLGALAIQRVPHRPLLGRIWQLHTSITVYDASYVALAEQLDTVLLTADHRLGRANGPRCQVEVLG